MHDLRCLKSYSLNNLQTIIYLPTYSLQTINLYLMVQTLHINFAALYRSESLTVFQYCSVIDIQKPLEEQSVGRQVGRQVGRYNTFSAGQLKDSNETFFLLLTFSLFGAREIKIRMRVQCSIKQVYLLSQRLAILQFLCINYTTHTITIFLQGYNTCTRPANYNTKHLIILINVIIFCFKFEYFEGQNDAGVKHERGNKMPQGYRSLKTHPSKKIRGRGPRGVEGPILQNFFWR